MHKKEYEAPEITLCVFLTEDVITTSGLNSGGSEGGGGDGWGDLFDGD